MRASDTLLEISRSVKDGADAAGLPREMLGCIAAESLRLGAANVAREGEENGEAFGDGDKAAVLFSFSRHAPTGFLLALPEIIEDNALGFDDEEELEQCICACLSLLVSENGVVRIFSGAIPSECEIPGAGAATG